MLSMFFYTFYNVVDAFWVGRLSSDAIAAVSISQLTLWIMVAVSLGMTVGSGVIMSMHIGAKNIKAAGKVLGQSFVLALIAALIFTTLSLLFRTQFLIASGATGNIFPLAMDYFTIVASGSVLLFLLVTIMFAFNSQGDTLTLTKLFALSTAINLILDPILIFGWFGAPTLGVAGAGYATLISQFVFVAIALYVLSRGNMMIRLRFSNLSFELESVKKVLAIGAPASLTQIVPPLGLVILISIVSSNFLEPGAVAFSIAFRIEFFAFLPALGFGVGSIAMIGQNLGAGRIDRARESFRTAIVYSFAIATAFGVIAIILSNQIIGIFATGQLVNDYTSQYIWSVALTYGFLSMMMVEASAFQGIGRSWPGFWIFLLKFFVIAIPISYVLASVLRFPIISVWIAILLGNLIASGVGYLWVRKAFAKLTPPEVPVEKSVSISKNLENES